MLIFALPAGAETMQTLKPVDAKYICMVNDTAFEKEQISVDVEGKTYFGCCSMCEARLKEDATIRTAIDPVSGNKIDKAEAVIGADANGKVYYFESAENLEKFKAEPDSEHSHMEHENMMPSDDLIKGSGVLNVIKTEENKVNITHGPIPALKWPDMTMDFQTSENIDLSNAKQGDEIVFFFKQDGYNYVIEKIEAKDGHYHEDHQKHKH
jgi:Cu/Ag efflux protein CusF